MGIKEGREERQSRILPSEEGKKKKEGPIAQRKTWSRAGKKRSCPLPLCSTAEKKQGKKPLKGRGGGAYVFLLARERERKKSEKEGES